MHREVVSAQIRNTLPAADSPQPPFVLLDQQQPPSRMQHAYQQAGSGQRIRRQGTSERRSHCKKLLSRMLQLQLALTSIATL